MGCNYGLMNDFFDTATLAMSGFFMLSGYSLYVAYPIKSLLETVNLRNFYTKRFISIYPLYIVVGLLSVLMYIVAGMQTITDNLLLLPIELLGIQSVFDKSLFAYAHNSGTWFISCIIICYFVFPFFKELVSRMKIKGVTLTAIIIIILLSYIHILPNRFECGDLYTNAFLRVTEFALGMLIAKINTGSETEKKWMVIIRSTPMWIIASVVMIVGVSLCNHFGVRGDLLTYFCLAIIFIGLGSIKPKNTEKEWKVLLYASSIAYAFYLSQVFVWNPTKLLLRYTGELGNLTLIGGTFAACVIVSIILHMIVEEKVGGYLKEKLIYTR